MKTFFDGVFISQKSLEEADIKYPIKLEYYKTSGAENVQKRFGIEVVKTEYIDGNVNIETKEIKNITDDEQTQDEILNLLKRNEVTPIAVQDIIDDLVKEKLNCNI